MPQFNIFDQTKAAIEDGSLREVVPAFYLQRRAIENNPWHTHDTVFNHVVNVFAALKKLVSLVDVAEPGKSWLKSYLAEQIINRPRIELVLWSGLLHDIAKPQTLITDENGITDVPGHEIIGAQMAEKILSGLPPELEMDRQEIEIVAQLVRNHMIPHSILDQKELEEVTIQFKELERKAPSIYWLQLMLALADMQGSQLAQTMPDDFQRRADMYYHLLSLAHA